MSLNYISVQSFDLLSIVVRQQKVQSIDQLDPTKLSNTQNGYWYNPTHATESSLMTVNAESTDLNIENTNIKTAPGVELDEHQRTLVGSVLDVRQALTSYFIGWTCH